MHDLVFNQKESFLQQVRLDVIDILPHLMLSYLYLQWLDRIKYLGVYVITGKPFCIGMSCNILRLSAVFGILRDEVKLLPFSVN